MTDPRYPIGKFDPVEGNRALWIQNIAVFPELLRSAVAALPEGGLDRSYRQGGWTGRQVVHHLADSHMNAYIRFRLALTEEEPTIKPYDEGAWALLEDARTADPGVSTALLDSLHRRWVLLMKSLPESQWSRTFLHPELGRRDLAVTAALYAWHGRHHLGHLALISGR